MASPIEHCLVNTRSLHKTICKTWHVPDVSVTITQSRTTILCGPPRDQRSLWFCQEQTKLILCYFYLLYPLWPVLKLEELKAKSNTRGCKATMLARTFSSLLLVPHSLYSGKKNSKKINSTFVDKDSLPAPHRGYNKSYESSACKFTGFRLTVEA